jgi:hypothetical protein
MTRSFASLAAAALLLVPTLAHAADGADGDDGDDGADAETTLFSHKGQVGVHAQLGSGYRVLFPYNEEYCGQTDSDGSAKSVCTGRSPFFLDVGLSYGINDAVELIGEARLGLERDFAGVLGTDGPRPISFAAGVRLYVDAEGRFKFFSSLEGVIETTDYAESTQSGSAAVDGSDYGIRNVNGIMFDFHRTFGLYAHFGETITFASWLRFELNAGLGVQVRFP